LTTRPPGVFLLGDFLPGKQAKLPRRAGARARLKTGAPSSLKPAPMTAVQGECDLAIIHGGSGTSSALLLAGRPLLLLPTQLERTVFARNNEKMGAGIPANCQLFLHLYPH